MNKKLIFATIGPSSMNRETIQKMDKLGVDIFRINLSHTEVHEFREIHNQVSKWTNKPICPDTEGAQLRTGKLPRDFINVNSNDIIELVGANTENNNTAIPLNIFSPENIIKQSRTTSPSGLEPVASKLVRLALTSSAGCSYTSTASVFRTH